MVRCHHRGPTRYQMCVLRALLRRPMHVPALMAATHLRKRTVLQQITFFRKAEAIKVERYIGRKGGHAGPWCVYAPVVHEV
jgi:hypothetical protein